jgi:hypothetical protein
MRGPHKEQWQEAEGREMASHKENGTWKLVKRQNDMFILSGKWIYKIKRGVHHNIECFKARWVVRGFEQVRGQDYNQTFASTVRMTVVRWLLAYCCMNGRELRQIDFITAFLNAFMDGEIIHV